MTAIIINLDDYRQEKEHSQAFQEALNAVAEYGKSPLKGIEAVDEYFKKYPFDADDIPQQRQIKPQHFPQHLRAWFHYS